MAVLLDTNILLRLLQPQHPHSAMTERALNILRRRNETLNIASQNLVECWAVMTRPTIENGLGLSVDAASIELEKFKRLFVLLPELPLQDAWERLVVSYRVLGKNTHDARLVAAMTVHQVDSVLTFNIQDFTRYSGITALDPRTVV
ncbi:MAG TPA: type II toxin-antitoxin system VapC family toxin [Acidobacteriaceae bacterium]|jgi:predicted nucleic acid-binding protein